MNDELVLVSKQELEELRALKASLPDLLEAARCEGGLDRLKVLHQKQKANPAEHREKSKKRYQEKRELILARRREIRQKKKAESESKAPDTLSQ
jgi:hypothetical protein